MIIEKQDLINAGINIPPNNITIENKVNTLILYAQDIIEKYTGTKFSLNEFNEYYDENYKNKLVLRNAPVNEIISLEVGDICPDFRLEKTTGIIKLSDSKFNNEAHIVYSAGYEEAPDAIKYAAIELFQYLNKRTSNELVGEKSKNFEGGNTSLETYIPQNVLFILNRFKNSNGVV